MMKAIYLALLVLAILSAGTAVSVKPYWISPKNATIGDDGDRLENFVAPKGEWADVPAGGIGSRSFSSVHFDSKGILWIFGGGADFVYLNAGWNYDLVSDRYRWVVGSDQFSKQLPLTLGTKGVESSNVFPGFVYAQASVIDSKDQIWMYTNTNHLFRWNTTSGNFAWMGGESYIPNIGTPGKPSPEAWPGLKDSPCMVVDSQDNFWLIGGIYDVIPTNTVWHYNTTLEYWTFVFGDPFNFTTNNYDENYFGGRSQFACEIDENDLIWIHGGTSSDVDYNFWGYGDLWTFDTTSKTWTVIQNDTINSLSTIDTRDEFSANNRPGARYNHAFVNRLDGTLMLYGGVQVPLQKFYDDIWLFNTTVRQWKIISGGINVESPGVLPERTNYRESGSVLGFRSTYGIASGKTNKGQFVMVGGVADGYRQKDIWIIPQDVCGLGLGNCLPEATCVMQDWLFFCQCPNGTIGNGITSCEIPLPPVAPPTAVETPSSMTPVNSSPLMTPVNSNTPTKISSAAKAGVTCVIGAFSISLM